MPRKQTTYWVFEGVIPKDICEFFLFMHFQGKEKTTAQVFATGQQRYEVDPNKRETNLVWSPPTGPVPELLIEYINKANDSAGWMYDLTELEGIQIAEYEPGGFFDWHGDIDFPRDDNSQRKISCSLQLSKPDAYEGGDLLVETAGNEIFTMPRTQGTIILFPSIAKHKVTPVTAGKRYSAVGWMRGPAFR